jgi:hypothetical protein
VTRPSGFSASYVSLKAFDVTPRKARDRPSAKERLNVAINAATIHRERRRLDPALGIGKVQVANFSHSDCVACRVPV